MRVLVCGGRDYQGDVQCLASINIDILIHGAAKGADLLAMQWAVANGIHHASVPALWDHFGKQQAGYKRNAAMLGLSPDYCVAFPGGQRYQDDDKIV